MWTKILLFNLLVIPVLLTKPAHKHKNQPIYFKHEPLNYYIIDSYLSPGDETTSFVIDCVTESKIFDGKYEVKWLKDNIELNSIAPGQNDEINREIMSNGSLKLTYSKSIRGDLATQNIFLVSTFKCLVNDAFGKILSRPSRIYRLLIENNLKNEVNFIRQPENTTLTIGKRLLLRCKPNLTSYIKVLNEKTLNLVQYQWFKDKKLIDLNTKTSIYKDGSLEIIQVDETDSGFYYCLAKFRSITFESRLAYVKVNPLSTIKPPPLIEQTTRGTPKFSIFPEDRIVQEEDEVIFECLAHNDANVYLTESSENFKYIWLKDGVALDFSNKLRKRIQLVQGVNLRVERVVESDSGTYTCRICNLGSESDECDERSGILKVLVSPRFIKRPQNVNVTLKSDAELECSAYGVPAPTIQWFKNGEPIYPSEYFQFNQNQGNLKILGIIAQDEGYYQCVASNDLNTIHTVAQLVVHTDDYPDLETDYLEFDSETKKSTSPVLLKLINTETTTTPIIHLSSPTNLKATKIKPKSIQIEWEPPGIMRGEEKLNQNLIYSINWKSKDTDRQRELNTTNTNFLIDELQSDTVYIITVRALVSSIIGPSVEIEVKTEQSISSAPLDFKAELIDYYSTDGVSSFNPTLKFKWKKPLQNSENILKYRLYYQHLHYGPVNNVDLHLKKNSSDEFRPVDMDVNDEETIDENTYNDDFEYETKKDEEEKSSEKYINIEIPSEMIDSDNYEFLLEDLQKYSTYKFRLVAIDKTYFEKLNETENSFKTVENEPLDEQLDENYLSQNSIEIIIETPGDVPDGSPENIIAETVNTTAILLQWDLPLIEKRNGLIIGYKIAIKENDKQVWHSNVDSEPRRKVISSLVPGHKYSFRVTAKTVNGSGPASDWIIAETFTHEMDETRVPGQPVEINAEPTDQSIVIQWLPPLDSNRTLVRKYLLKYGIGFPDTEIEILGTKNSFIINNLVPSSQYVLSLKAANNAGFGMEILKDVVTKRKSSIGENENLFPPLNVQAVAISSNSIEVRWTDWHLKPDESIPDDRIYSVRYNIAELSNAKYKYKNATERNVIISDLKSNTLYDFSVRLIVNRRESEWSMTTSQMTLESSPAPSDITIKSDQKSPNNVIITWKAPNLAQNSGYIIYYSDEKSIKENSNKKWKNEIINSVSNSDTKLMKHTIRKLNLETVYYFKIQARNNRAYGSSSPTVIFKTPNLNGDGGGQIYTPKDLESTEPTVVLNKNESSSNKVQLEINFIWVITACISCLFLIVVILVAVLVCKKGESKTEAKNFNRNNLNSSKRPLKGRVHDPYDRNDEEEETDFPKNGLLQQQQQLLLNTNMIPNSSNTSTLLKPKTPHHQPLLINNPNHMMMNVMNPLSLSNTHNSDMEYYSNQQGLFTSNSHANSDASCYNSETFQYQTHNFIQSTRNGSVNGDHDDPTNSAIQQANAAFNAPFNGNFIPSVNINTSEPMFLRQTVRPKPIAIPINPTPMEQNSSMFSINNPTRKSYKNLPIATATLISNQTINFNNSTNSQKIHYTARPYIIDNQVQSGELSNHSPASSSHSGCPSQVYDKIGNMNTSSSSSKSLLQPLKSFSNNNQMQSPSLSIPSTPAKYCEVSLTSNSNTSTTISKGNNFSLGGKSVENIYEKRIEPEEMTDEMANLEGIMKDLNAITAQQFEC